MKTQGRENVHGKGGVRFKAGWDKNKKVAMLRNLTTNLIVNGHIVTTFQTAKQISRIADRLVTYAKKGDLASRRLAARFVRANVVADKANDQDAVQKLFAVYGPKYKSRKGGYTKVLKAGNRKGDNAAMALIAFVD